MLMLRCVLVKVLLWVMRVRLLCWVVIGNGGLIGVFLGLDIMISWDFCLVCCGCIWVKFCVSMLFCVGVMCFIWFFVMSIMFGVD